MNAMTEENKAKFYPQDVDSLFTGSNKDTHVAYYGEIVNAYVIEYIICISVKTAPRHCEVTPKS